MLDRSGLGTTTFLNTKISEVENNISNTRAYQKSGTPGPKVFKWDLGPENPKVKPKTSNFL